MRGKNGAIGSEPPAAGNSGGGGGRGKEGVSAQQSPNLAQCTRGLFDGGACGGPGRGAAAGGVLAAVAGGGIAAASAGGIACDGRRRRRRFAQALAGSEENLKIGVDSEAEAGIQANAGAEAIQVDGHRDGLRPSYFSEVDWQYSDALEKWKRPYGIGARTIIMTY